MFHTSVGLRRLELGLTDTAAPPTSLFGGLEKRAVAFPALLTWDFDCFTFQPDDLIPYCLSMFTDSRLAASFRIPATYERAPCCGVAWFAAVNRCCDCPRRCWPPPQST